MGAREHTSARSRARGVYLGRPVPRTHVAPSHARTCVKEKEVKEKKAEGGEGSGRTSDRCIVRANASAYIFACVLVCTHARFCAHAYSAGGRNDGQSARTWEIRSPECRRCDSMDNVQLTWSCNGQGEFGTDRLGVVRLRMRQQRHEKNRQQEGQVSKALASEMWQTAIAVDGPTTAPGW